MEDWINIKDKMPERNVCVLVETVYCKYPASVAYFNGVNWVSIDGCELGNTEHWTPLPTPTI